MDRRRFLLTSLAGALAVPLAAEAQQARKVDRIGVLLHRALRMSGTSGEAKEQLGTAVTTLRDMGMTYWLEKTEAEMGQLA